jgi:formate--tetrahydrofolate ligase
MSHTPDQSHDLKIAQKVALKSINEISEKLGLSKTEIEHYGKYKAKIPLDYIDEEKLRKSNLILVTAITPTPAGEGKTTISVGLADGLNRMGKHAMAVLREPSLGPVFGIKGGATGGGYSQVVPMEDINLHFTGDFGAIEKANNLLSALINNSIHRRNKDLDIDPRTVRWRWVMDMNDRSLRHVITGLGGKQGGFLTETGFDITAASEVMAALCLSRDLHDLRTKLGNIYIGDTFDGKPVYARDLKAQGAMTVLLKDAIKPNLVQTLEGNPVIIHGGPFANIAQGTNSLIATKLGMSLSDYVVTEAGFGADLGAEKFFNIKCRYGQISPRAVVLVATVRALKYHGGASKSQWKEPNLEALINGIGNLDRHIENLKRFGIPIVVAVNRFADDSDQEINYILHHCERLGVDAQISEGWAKGSEGTVALAKNVIEAVNGCTSKFVPTYNLQMSIKEKIKKVAGDIYGARKFSYTQQAEDMIKRLEDLEMQNMPVCIAKTQSSLTDDASLRGNPGSFTIHIREIEVANGAGFIIPITGKMLRMPGLPVKPAAEFIDIDENENVVGLS